MTDSLAPRFNVAAMNSRVFMLVAFAAALLFSRRAMAHPGSGIVVDSQGQVFFQDSAARTVWKIDAQGRTTAYSDEIGGHWMAVDEKDNCGSLKSELVERIAPTSDAPALLIADGGAPIAIHGGMLIYGLQAMAGAQVDVGLTRIWPPDRRVIFAPKLASAIESMGVTGLASGADGKLYAACLTDVMRISADGTFAKLMSGATIPGCDSDAPTCFLRGLAVDASGDCYVAATGCRCVIKISPNGVVETVMKAERPWSPTGVAAHAGEVYALEYTNANGGAREGWLPRIRKLARDGKVTTLVTISAERQRGQPRFRQD